MLLLLQADAHEPLNVPPNMPGSCHLSPQAAAALHFWLNHNAVSPHVQATYLHNMHAGMTDPGHAFPGISCLPCYPRLDACACIIWVGCVTHIYTLYILEYALLSALHAA